jgi:hypothetical protein
LAAENGSAYPQTDVHNVFTTSALFAAKTADTLILLDTLEQLDNFLTGSVSIKSANGGTLQISRKKGSPNLLRVAKAKASNARFGGTINDLTKIDVQHLKAKDKLAHYAKCDDMDNCLISLPSLKKSHIDFNYLNKGFYPCLSVEPRSEFPEWFSVIEAYDKSIVRSIKDIKNFFGYLADYLFVYLV